MVEWKINAHYQMCPTVRLIPLDQSFGNESFCPSSAVSRYNMLHLQWLEAWNILKTNELDWIGLRENLQETMDFPMKYGVFIGFPWFSCKKTLEPIHCCIAKIFPNWLWSLLNSATLGASPAPPRNPRASLGHGLCSASRLALWERLGESPLQATNSKQYR